MKLIIYKHTGFLKIIAINETYKVSFSRWGCISYKVFRKNVFFTIHCNSSLAYIEKDLQSSQRNASKKSLQLAGNFLYNQ